MTEKVSPLQTEKYHTMKLSNPWYGLVKDDVKKFEIRLYDEKRQDIKLNDLIKFTDTTGENEFFKRVDHLSVHKTCELSLKKAGLKKALPGIKSFAEGIKVYHSIPGYKEGEAKYRTLLIGLQSGLAKPHKYRKI